MARALEGLTRLVTRERRGHQAGKNHAPPRRHLMVTRSQSMSMMTPSDDTESSWHARESRPMGARNAVSSLSEALDKLSELQQT